MQFINRNICKSFNLTVGTTVIPLSSFPCTMATIRNTSSVDIYVWDDPDAGTAANRAMLVKAGTEYTFHGLTNSDQLSAKATSGSAIIYVRTQYFTGHTVSVGP